MSALSLISPTKRRGAISNSFIESSSILTESSAFKHLASVSLVHDYLSC